MIESKKKRTKMDDENHQHIFNVQILSPRVIAPPLPPQTSNIKCFLRSSSCVSLTTRSENNKETDSDETDSDRISTDKRDPKNLTFDEYVDGDAGRVVMTMKRPDYDYGEVNVEEAERSEQESKLITEKIDKMKAGYSERYHKTRSENKWKLPSEIAFT